MAAFGCDCQSSLASIVALSESRTSWNVGFESEPGTPKLARDGPIARMTTLFGADPPLTKPPIITSNPVCTWPLVEMLASRGGSMATVWLKGEELLAAYVALPA